MSRARFADTDTSTDSDAGTGTGTGTDGVTKPCPVARRRLRDPADCRPPKPPKSASYPLARPLHLLPVMHLPRERLSRLGPTTLSDAELLALILGTGRAGEDVGSLAIRVLRDTGGLWALTRMSAGELARIAGIGPAKAARIAAAFELGSRSLVSPHLGAAPLSNSETVFLRYGRQLMASQIERFMVVSVDAKNRARAEREVARGGRTSCQVDPAEVFRLLVSESASGAIFVHNHPSGDPDPSRQDLELTQRLVSAGSLLGIRILDHLIVGSGRYTSLRDAGLWPTSSAKSNGSTEL